MTFHITHDHTEFYTQATSLDTLRIKLRHRRPIKGWLAGQEREVREFILLDGSIAVMSCPDYDEQRKASNA